MDGFWRDSEAAGNLSSLFFFSPRASSHLIKLIVINTLPSYLNPGSITGAASIQDGYR
jgi:hypothetical protein